ncbi:hypothetical protein TBLA_0C05220 [Henningerozyma blattae CBS 6284]|uniref:2-dehydropantoate 2-reductase n=1 Tax=Henningerozyma blattae (strain ATCC 34711 / CBS 6284 / DSM 70876 / NBRC 10599 / NRRL Y-10934 / UCD 77-7) TaxID=1071380 RepID=I2H1R6_HENB6|nr:hypothetical protein TBLA_0C05220 [Tetrapisispora blattae CBS 6284]CCH60318.1 hypothetical protein TBLA_0C05220 [Tetrapisispora blattae CBS 6284]
MTNTKIPTIHILGLGAMGTVFSIDLARYTNSKIIPLFRNKSRLLQFQNENNNQSQLKIRKIYLPESPIISAKFNDGQCPETFSKQFINNLVITTKTYQTKEALEPYLPYINSKTNLILIQNGFGVLDVLRDEVFNNVKVTDRPTVFQGVISHGVFQDSKDPYLFIHAGHVGMKVAKLPWEINDEIFQNETQINTIKSNNEMIELFTSEPFAKEFGLEFLTYQEMLLGQISKFLVNCCINPITSIVNGKNGEIGNGCSDIFKLIVIESLKVLELEYKELFEYESKYNDKIGYPKLSVNKSFEIEPLVESIINTGCRLNGENSSSMRQDTLYLRDIEIDYINGYIIKLVQKHQLSEDYCKINESICALAKLRLIMNRERAAKGIDVKQTL